MQLRTEFFNNPNSVMPNTLLSSSFSLLVILPSIITSESNTSVDNYCFLQANFSSLVVAGTSSNVQPNPIFTKRVFQKDKEKRLFERTCCICVRSFFWADSTNIKFRVKLQLTDDLNKAFRTYLHVFPSEMFDRFKICNFVDFN